MYPAFRDVALMPDATALGIGGIWMRSRKIYGGRIAFGVSLV